MPFQVRVGVCAFREFNPMEKAEHDVRGKEEESCPARSCVKWAMVTREMNQHITLI